MSLLTTPEKKDEFIEFLAKLVVNPNVANLSQRKTKASQRCN